MTHLVAVAANDLPEGASGQIVYWSLSGATNVGKLQAAFEVHGLDTALLPPAPSPGVALRRAVIELRERGVLVRPLRLPADEEGGEGYVLVHESFNERGRPTHARGMEVKLVNGELQFSSDADDAEELHVRQAWARHLTNYAHADVSSALVRWVYNLDGQALRATGGFYFIPREMVSRWAAFVAAVRAVSSHRLYAIPALQTDEAVEAVLDALREEAAAELEKFQDELDGGEMSARRAKGRMTKVFAMRDKVKRYESLLGRSMTDLHGLIDDVDLQLAVCMLQAD